MSGSPNSQLSPRFFQIFTFVTVMTIGLFGSLVWYAFNTYRYLETTQKTYFRLLELSGSIVHLDEVLTMSARMAAATGDRKWETRYRSFEPDLDAAIKETMVIGEKFSLHNATAKTDNAILKLENMENQALDLAMHGRNKDAMAILSSTGYEAEKKNYNSGIDKVTETMKEDLKKDIAGQRQEGYLAVIAILIATPCIAFGWLLVVRSVRHHNIKRMQAEEDLQTLNAELEQRVSNRTKELETSNAELAQATHALNKAYKELQTTQSQMLQSEKMASIGQLAAGVAHEINNPIGFISSNLGTLSKYLTRLTEFTDTLMKAQASNDYSEAQLKELHKKLKIDFIGQDAKDLVKESLDGTDRVCKIVQGLKSFSRVDEAEYKTVDINECLESTLNIVWNELKYKATVSKDYGKLPLTNCYPQQLNQVFMNLLVNAAHAIDKQGEIGIKTWQQEKSIFVSISDTGFGIPPENKSRIFEPFFTTKEVGKGTGLGLSISYEIIKKHDGEIVVDSEPGKGTTFTIRLPESLIAEA